MDVINFGLLQTVDCNLRTWADDEIHAKLQVVTWWNLRLWMWQYSRDYTNREEEEVVEEAVAPNVLAWANQQSNEKCQMKNCPYQHNWMLLVSWHSFYPWIHISAFLFKKKLIILKTFKQVVFKSVLRLWSDLCFCAVSGTFSALLCWQPCPWFPHYISVKGHSNLSLRELHRMLYNWPLMEGEEAAADLMFTT